MIATLLALTFALQSNPDVEELDRAVMNHQIDRVKAILTVNPGRISAKASYGRTPLFFAVGAGWSDLIRLLVARGADVNAKSDRGQQPIHAAAQGSLADVILLVKLGAPINAANDDGVTIATTFWPESMGGLVRFPEEGLPRFYTDLSKLGLNLNAFGYRHMTALMHVAQDGDVPTVRALLKSGSSPELKDGDGHTAAQLASEDRQYHPKATDQILELLRRAEKSTH